MRIQTSRKSGFTLVEIMIVVAIIGLLAAIAIPNYVKARTTAQKNACIANLKQLEGAKQQWALEKNKVSSDTPTDGDIFDDALYIKQKPICPASGTYAFNTVGANATCTIAEHTLTITTPAATPAGGN